MFDAEELKVLKDMEARTDTRFQEMDTRLTQMEERTDARFQQIDMRLTEMEERTDARFQQIDTRFTQMEERTDARFQEMEERFSTQLKEMEERIIAQSTANMRVLLESYVEPKFNLLAEGQKMLLETMAPLSRVERLEDEVAFMKQVIKAMSQDIAELKQAQ